MEIHEPGAKTFTDGGLCNYKGKGEKAAPTRVLFFLGGLLLGFCNFLGYLPVLFGFIIGRLAEN